MRIGVNAFPLRVARGGALYAFAGLMEALLRIDAAHQYVLFCHPASLPSLGKMLGAALSPQMKIITVLDEEMIHLHRDDFDLYVGPLNDLRPRIYDRPTVAMLMDIQQEYFPELFTHAEKIARRDAYLEICRAATIVVTISEFCKNTFIEKFGVDARKIQVMHLAPQPRLLTSKNAWARSSLPPYYFFYPAQFYPHKNHATLLNAVQKLDSTASIIFAGNYVPGGFPLAREIARRGLSERCRVFSELSVEEMRHLYAHAAATVMPTKFEGFGMPAVEAMACGCPLVCSDIPPLREVAGECALYFDPNDPVQLAEQLCEIKNNPRVRHRLIESGNERAMRFTWEAAAQKMIAVFAESCRRFKHGYDQSISASTPPATRIGIARSPAALETEPIATHFVNLPITAGEPPTQLFERARQSQLDLIGVLGSGDHLRDSACDSLSLSFQLNPTRAVHIGEACVWKVAQYIHVARLRRTGDELWKLEGMLYPGMFYLAPAALERWPAGMDILRAGGADWRWKLLRAAFVEDQIALLRRTLIDCQYQSTPRRNGMAKYYRCTDGHPAKTSLLRVFEETARQASQRMPLTVQKLGAAAWYRMTR